QERPLVVRHQDGRGIAPDAEERAVAQGDLTAVSDEEVEPEHDDRPGRRGAEVDQAMVGHAHRHPEHAERGAAVPDGLPQPVLRRPGRDDDGRPPVAHTRSTLLVPNRPSGRTTRATTITTRAITRLSSEPMNVNSAGIRASARPTMTPPTTA